MSSNTHFIESSILSKYELENIHSGTILIAKGLVEMWKLTYTEVDSGTYNPNKADNISNLILCATMGPQERCIFLEKEHIIPEEQFFASVRKGTLFHVLYNAQNIQ